MSETNDAMWASMLNNCNGQNAWLNNPFLYLIFLAMFGNGNFFGGRNCAAESNLAQTMADNHNSDLLMGAIKGNGSDLNTLASSLGCDANSIKSAIQSLGSTFQQCCCENGKETMKMGYESQISNLQNSGAVLGRIDQLANGIQSGFSQVGYATQAQTCALQNSISEGNQRIIDTMNNHWNQDLRDKLYEMSQNAQTASIVSQLKTT